MPALPHEQPRTHVASEFATPPSAVLVHDPVAAGAFDSFAVTSNRTNLEHELLFRALPDTQQYAAQHETFVRQLREHVPGVFYVSDLLGDEDIHRSTAANPNQVFTRDSLITLPWVPKGYMLSRMRPQQRRQESRVMEAAVRSLGLQEIARVPEGLFLEGGDVIPFARNGRRTLLIGWGPRSRLEAVYYLQQVLIPRYVDEIIALKLANWRMNLDGGLMPVADDVVIADVDSITQAIQLDHNGSRMFDVWDMFRSLGVRIIRTSREESIQCQSCNCVCLGNRRVIYYDLCDRVNLLLHRHDIETFLVPGSELVKGRGGPRCMSRPIYWPVSVQA